MSENLIERYLTDMGEVRGTRSNVPETSFYPALERLLSDIGKSFSPKVRCVINLANRGAGLPDGGLFSADQFRRKTREADADENFFRYVTEMARRLAALVALQTALDANYREVTDSLPLATGASGCLALASDSDVGHGMD
jgi:hypothetical protein